MTVEKTIDKKDELILEELKKDSRMATKKIAAILKIPRVTVHDRIKKMIEKGVIKKFTLIPDYKKIGQPTLALVFVSFDLSTNTSERMLSRKISEISKVYEIYVITGEYDIMLKIRGESIEDISRTIINKIRSINGVAKTLTITCTETIKERN